MQTRTRPCIIGDNSSRISRNKAALRNKLLKNAKSIQRNRCRSDNIAAVIESVVRKCHETEKKSDSDVDKTAETENEDKKDAKEMNEGSSKATSKALDQNDRTVRPRVVGRPKILGKKRNVKNPQLQSKSSNKLVKAMGRFAKFKNDTTSETKDEGEETSSPKSIPKNAKTTLKAIDKDDVNADSKKISTISGVKNKNKLTQNILKRKRPVDPVASLNASIKAKSQLRTQDGKFARNPNKNLPAKSSEEKIDNGKYKTNWIEIKPKLKAAQKLKKIGVQLPRRITRLSSDSDKMPTLEPVVQIVSSNEEYADKSANDLPILSPVTSSGSLQDQKASRISIKCILKEKEENVEANADLETIPEKRKRGQKSTRGRKPKEEMKDMTKRKKTNTVEENNTSKNNVVVLKDDRTKGRKSLPVLNANNGENSKEETSKKEAIAKKDSKPKKEEAMKETRSNSKTRVNKDFVKLTDIPFEVKKLLYSAQCILDKDDLLSTLELASNDSKRNLRQLAPRSKVLQVSDKKPRELDDESDGSKDTSKKEKIEVIKKSSRKNIEKKGDDKIAKMSLEKDSTSNAIANVAQNERNQQGKRDRAVKTKEINIDNPDMKSKIDGRQTRGSVSDVKSEPFLEIANDSLRKGRSLLGKRRSRNRSLDKDEETNLRTSKAQSSSENASSSGKETEKELGEVIDKISKKEIEGESDKNSDDRLDSTVVNINLSHLQSETSNLSIDSGKENSLETSVNVHSKLKVGRPKKSWGARREKSLRKRSLNNVIGILTEGMNIPMEAQQNVQVLTVQTSLDNPDRLARNGSAQQPSGGEGNVIVVDSAFSELSVLAKSEEKSAENEAVTATSTTDNSHVDDEKNACSDEAQLENVFADGKVDVSVKVTTVKACSPANDIILDLSRRKPKGKGSFLEKIVSKIAKQKDALLEGEVGSLLDTAADELTSILDEVGPTLIDNTENTNSDEANHASKNDKSMTVTSTDKELPVIVEPEIQALENEKTNVESAISKCSTDSLEMSDDLEENLATKTEIQSENQIKADNVSDVEMKNDDDLHRKVSSVEENVESCENKSMINKEPVIPIKISNDPVSLTDISISGSLIMTQKENLEKPERKKGVTKSRRKSNKRSLDARSKKNKKRSLEIVEDRTEENAQKKLGMNDTFKADIGNEFSKKDDSVETSNGDIEVRKSELLQHNESEIIKDDLKPTNLEKNLTKADNELNLEKFTDFSEITCENAKLIASLEKSLDKITSDEDTVTNDRSIESIEKSTDFSILSSEKSVECKKSVSRNKKKNQVNSNGSSSRRKSKRKSKSVLSITPSMYATINILQTSVDSMDETEEIPSSSSIARESLESTNIQSIKIGTTSDSDVPLENFLHSVEIVPEKPKETQNTDLKNSSLVNSIPSKTTEKHGAKKKSLAEEHLKLPEDKSAKVVLKLTDEFSIADTNERLSVSLEHFKIPEVKDLPQSAKKRGLKKKSQPEDDRWNSGSVSEASRTNEKPTEIDEISNSIEEKVEEQKEIEKRVTEEQSSTKKLGRSSSSGSIGLAPSLPKTRSMFKRKTQLSNEDLADSSIRNQSAESMDDLSESSCVSESSYFRKKRFAKKKRKEETVVDSTRTDASLTDSIILKSSKQNLKRKTSKTKSLLDEHLDLSDVDDIDIPMDIQASLENIEALEKIEREFEFTEKSLDPQNEDTDKPTDDTENKDSHATLERPASNNHDSSDNPVTPKKRAAGNFVVVHTKTGEILIVEKRKKLTKEAARFFCDVCATSFTRKSSLKKHTLSQSHLSQLTKSTKDKIESVNSNTFENIEEDDNEWKNNQENDQQTKNIPEDARSHETDRKSLELDESFVPYANSTELTKSLVDLGTRQMLEDKLLDEEICKITENMSHDEYVLTDQVTPEDPMLSSMPIKAIQKKQEDSRQGKNSDKKRNKSKKRNLAEEHLLLDSPKLENSKIDSDELPKPTNDVMRVSSPSCDHSSTEQIMETIEKIGDISKECVDNVKTKNRSELTVKSLNEETTLRSICDIDGKTDQQTESTRTTKKTLRKVSKVYNEEKEETSALTETNRFSLRPRRSKNIQHYEESDIEADIYFMDTSMEINSDEIEDSRDAQKRQNEVKEGTNRDVLQENVYVATDDKRPQDVEVAKSKTDSTNRTKKKKRGRPRLKDRIISNFNNTSAPANLEVNGNDSVATSNLNESKIEDQKLNLHTKERLDKTDKPPHIDANAQPPKRSRGRPRKNPVSITNNSSVQADNSSASESTKSNYDEVKEKADVIKSCSKMIIEETTSISSLIPNAESSPAIQEHTLESNLSETKKDLLNTEDVQSTELNISKDRSAQRIEPTSIAIDDTVFARNCENMLTSNIPSEKVEILMPLETNTYVDDAKCVLEDKQNDTNVNVVAHLTTESSAELSLQITEQMSIDDLKSAESKAIEFDNNESFEIPKSTDILEEKQTKSREEVPNARVLSLEDEDKASAEDNKSLLITNFHESQKVINDSGNDSTCDERTIRLESTKKLSRKSTSKERETDRKRLKTSKDKKKKIKVAELSSDSDNEDDRLESAASSKSKIVKSVFGRVFGGEKADKVKEVLNDWVSRSEDDSDISRSALDARSYLRGLTKFSENGHKKEKKCYFGSETKKNTERLPKKKGNEKCSSEVHGKAKNRKKREKDTELISEDRMGLPINPAKRRYRESKIRADEKILRAFDDELLTISDEENKIKEMSDQINNELNNKDKETSRHHEKDSNKERTKNKNLTSENWESLRVEHAHGKSKNSSNHRKKQDAKERSSSPSQSESEYKWRESKTKAGERIWRAFDNEISSCLSNDQDLNEFHEISKEQQIEFYELEDLNRSDNSKSVKQKDDDAWKNVSSIDHEQSVVHSGCGRSRKNSNSRKKQDFSLIKINKTKTNKRISKDYESSISSRDRETKSEMQNVQTILSKNESRNRSKTLIKDSSYEFFYGDSVVSKHMNKDQDNLLTHLDRSTSSRKNKKRIVNEDWKHSARNLKFDLDDDQPTEKEIGQKEEESTIASCSCSSLAAEEPIMKNQLVDLDGSSQMNRKSDDNDNDNEEDDDSDFERRRMSPFYARETPDNSIESSSEEEEEEEEDDEEEEEEEERVTYEDNSRKTNPSEFSGEKIIIRSPSSGHRSDVVTIAPTDAMEDNALDVPREIESTTEPRQGKILNFDEELFVECCSRLKATSENELRGAKKIKLDHTESYHRRDDQSQGFRVNRDRWRDVESQNSLGSLLESVNQVSIIY